MALPTFHLLGSVVTALFAAHTRGLERLAVHYSGTRLRVPLEADPHALTQGGMHLLPGSVQAPGAEVVVDGLPGWEVVGQEPPGAATANDVEEDGVQDFAGGVHLGTSGSFRCGQVSFEELHSASDRSLWYAFLMLGILPSEHFRTSFQTVS